MAREAADREDLLREATALIQRVELKISSFDEPIVVGFRRDGAASFYFGHDAVYQFNATGALRRGFLEGQLYKAVGGQLVALMPVRTAEQTELRRHDLSDAESKQFVDGALQRLRQLMTSLTNGEFSILGQIPPQTDLVGRIRDWLTQPFDSLPIAGSPRL
ncbi:MAG: hypothetical protein IT427_08155 [Pirellulales bacterium]|nr:hypothetical protein [Pirellulales bacterium]